MDYRHWNKLTCPWNGGRWKNRIVSKMFCILFMLLHSVMDWLKSMHTEYFVV